MILRRKLLLWAACALSIGVFSRASFGFALEGPKWPAGTIPMVIQAGTPNFVLPDGFTDWNADAENALAEWNEQMGGVQFRWTEADPGTTASNTNTDNKNSVFFSNNVFGGGFGGKETLAVTVFRNIGNVMIEADVIFNTAVGFSSGVNVGPGKDFHRVALHEFGHVLGLDHPDEAQPKQNQPAIMDSTVSSLNHLTEDDAAGVQFLYGAPANPAPVTGNARLANISTRALVGTGDNVLIAGFVLRDQTKSILARVIGPTLANFGVPGPLADPMVGLHNGTGDLIFSNDNWKDSQQSQIQQTGLAPTNDLESAIAATLPPGSYTAIVSGNNGGAGVGLVEVYDLDPANGRASNISTRGLVSTGDNVMIAGFIVKGPQLKNVVLRGIGPGLQGVVPSPLPDTTIELRNSQGDLLQTNTGWQSDSISSAFVSFYQLTPKSTGDSALYNELAPGDYTVILKSPSNATGIGLVEVYDVD
ncbi:MAG: hypothetical protein QOH24_281 [Verrucomicrobiota bacterium]